MFLEMFFTVTVLSKFVLRKRFIYADVLAFGDHRTARIEYKYLRVGYKVELFREFSRKLFQSSSKSFSGSFSESLS